MSDLTSIEKRTLEKLFEMGSGYVLNFSDRTFNDFVFDNTAIDIKHDKYCTDGASKARRLRSFWKLESNHTVGRLTKAFLEYWSLENPDVDKTSEAYGWYTDCVKIPIRLLGESPIDQPEVFKPNTDDREFSLLAKSIRESIDKNEPEAALDRLHTFVTKYVRQLCVTHNLTHEKDEPLNALFGKYVKYLSANKRMDSTMAERILKYSINVLEAFNDVRNNKSFAHDNPILNYHESVLIFNNIANAIKFIETLEKNNQTKEKKESLAADLDDLPF
jgi:hypothetical protein